MTNLQETRGKSNRYSAAGATVLNPAEIAAGNEALIRRLFEEFVNRPGAAGIEEIVSVDFVDHVPLVFPNQPTAGPAALEWMIGKFQEAFPDLTATVDEVVCSQDVAVARISWRGTHTGEIFGITPTQRSIRVTGLDMVHIRDGKFVEHWGQLDIISVLDQLNYLPEFDEPMG